MAATPTPATGARAANRALLKKLVVVAAVMFGFGFALIPFYDQICRATGLRNIDQADEVANTQVDTSRTIRVELDSNLQPGLRWTFAPEQPFVTVHPGEVKQILYRVTNTTDRPVTGQAIASYSPQNAALYFKKLECFCFTRQTIGPHETREMPVVFVLDPKLPHDMPTVSLSYTFFEVEGTSAG
ncbi:MAG: cytochrome c oxidase assembly protein [Proteobacteria bacterium]|nr:cytochrome c oxidase assembly protein [Pseudomonadota bacterium]